MKFDVFCRKIEEATALGSKKNNLSSKAKLYDKSKPLGGQDKSAYFDKFIKVPGTAEQKKEDEKEEKVPEVQRPDDDIIANEKMEDKKRDVVKEIAELFKKALDSDTADILDTVKESGLIEAIKKFIRETYSDQDGVQPSDRIVALTNIETIADQVEEQLTAIFATDRVEDWDRDEPEDDEEDDSETDYDGEVEKSDDEDDTDEGEEDDEGEDSDEESDGEDDEEKE